MKKFFKSSQNIIILLISIIIFVAPLVVNYSDLPKGFEIPKVHFLNIAIAITFIIYLGIRFHNPKAIRPNKKIIALILIVLAIFALSTLLSQYVPIALYGNSFRDQGLVFYTLIFIAGVVVFQNISRKNQWVLFLSLFLSAIIQASVGVSQFFRLLNSRPELIDDGYWINGTYGQANFFSSHLVLGFIAGIYLILLTKNILNKKLQFLARLLIIIGILLTIVSTIASFSIFGWITLVLSIFIIIPYLTIKKDLFYKTFIIFIFLAIIVGFIVLTKVNDNLRIDIWNTSLRILINDLQDQPLKAIFGYGFDTLGHVFRNAGEFPGVLIDRGHNIFIDVVMQVGILGLAIFNYLCFLVLRNLKIIVNKPELFFLFLVFFMFLVKAFIHEYSAVNLFVFFVLFGAILGRIIQDQQLPNSEKAI